VAHQSIRRHTIAAFLVLSACSPDSYVDFELPFEKPDSPPEALPDDECYEISDSDLNGDYMPWCTEQTLCGHLVYDEDQTETANIAAVRECSLGVLRDREPGFLVFDYHVGIDSFETVVEIVDDEIAVQYVDDDNWGKATIRAIWLKQPEYFTECLSGYPTEQWDCLWSIEDEDASCALGSDLACPE